MPRVVFTPNLRRHLSCDEVEVTAKTVREALDSTFESNPRLKNYVLDDQGRLRRHVVVFVDGQRVEDDEDLGDPVSEEGEIYVMQALSGGRGDPGRRQPEW